MTKIATTIYKLTPCRVLWCLCHGERKGCCRRAKGGNKQVIACNHRPETFIASNEKHCDKHGCLRDSLSEVHLCQQSTIELILLKGEYAETVSRIHRDDAFHSRQVTASGYSPVTLLGTVQHYAVLRSPSSCARSNKL